MIMELHGAKDYFDCTNAIMVTNGQMINNALKVAEKLKIEILEIPVVKINFKSKTQKPSGKFESIWEKYVMPLEGKTIIRAEGKTNKILSVHWSGIKRLTSNEKRAKN
jgi:restriction system protein